MPGLIKELHGSRTFNVGVNGGDAKFLYMIANEPDEATAEALVRATAPASWYAYTLVDVDMSDRPNLSTWFPVVNYKIPAFAAGSLPSSGDAGTGPPSPDTSPSASAPTGSDPLVGVDFSVVTEMQRVYRSFATVSSTKITGEPNPPDFGKLVGVDRDGRIEGVDVPKAVASFRRRVTLQGITQTYFRNLLKVVGRTNEVAWWGFPAEDLLLAGVSGSQRNDTEFDMNFEFKYSPTETSIVIRSGLTVATKAGWHYLWCATRREKDATANLMVEIPYAAYVERVIGVASFNWLGI